MDNNDPEKFKYFRVGDIVLDDENSCWEDHKFTIASFFGEKYCPMCVGYFTGQERSWKTRSNLRVKVIILIDSLNRPFAKISKPVLIKLIQKGNLEAKREFIMRSNAVKYRSRIVKNYDDV